MTLPNETAPADETAPFGPLIETTMRVATWNLWWRFGPWETRQPAIVATMRAVDADVWCLQEVFDDGEGNQAADLADALGYDFVYAEGADLVSAKFGNAILSRWPIGTSRAHRLPALDAPDEHRLVVRADVEGPRGVVQAFSTHLNWRFDHSAVRQAQVAELVTFVLGSRPRSYPPVIGGDFNAAPDSDEIRTMTGRAASSIAFHDAWEVAGDGPGLTWSNANPFAAVALEPARRIDYLFTGWPKAGGAGHVVRCGLVGTAAVDGTWPSDHLGVWADLRY